MEMFHLFDDNFQALCYHCLWYDVATRNEERRNMYVKWKYLCCLLTFNAIRTAWHVVYVAGYVRWNHRHRSTGIFKVTTTLIIVNGACIIEATLFYNLLAQFSIATLRSTVHHYTRNVKQRYHYTFRKHAYSFEFKLQLPVFRISRSFISYECTKRGISFRCRSSQPVTTSKRVPTVQAFSFFSTFRSTFFFFLPC